MRLAAVTVILAVLLAALCTAGLAAQPRVFTILHTNDLHSHLQGVSPELDYTPLSPGDDPTLGGWARLAAAIQAARLERNNPVLVLDAGDFLMGSLFHLVAREQALELSLLREMGYDAVSLGNHEFDLMPDGLARILLAAQDRLPPVLFASAVFDLEDPRDDSLERVFAAGLVQRYRIIERGGVRFGLFAVMGQDAAEVAPFASPVGFRDMVEVSREMVALLRDKEKAEVVICLSHSGLSKDPKKSEDLLLAREVPGIDLIVSGHTHTRLEGPIQAGGTLIVQAWEYGKQLGVLDFEVPQGGTGVRLLDWKALSLDDSIRGDPVIQARIEAGKRAVDRGFLAPHGWSYSQVLGETGFDLKAAEAETGLGNLVADSIRWRVDRLDSDPGDPGSRVTLAVESGGVIRDEILKGSTGRLTVADLFRVLPLGVGLDGSMAYPLISIYLSGAELRKALEIVASVHPLKGSDYFLQVSGVRFTYNPRRVLFDRVSRVEIGSAEQGWERLDTSRGNTTLYRVVANYYNSAFLKLIGSFTFGILDIVPKDRSGAPIGDLADARVDADPARPGLQELKEWVGLLEYMQSFPDADGDGIPEIPARYAGPEGRIVRAPSWSPVALLAGAGWVTWAAIGAVVLALALVAGVVLLILWLIRRTVRRGSARRPA